MIYSVEIYIAKNSGMETKFGCTIIISINPTKLYFLKNYYYPNMIILLNLILLICTQLYKARMEAKFEFNKIIFVNLIKFYFKNLFQEMIITLKMLILLLYEKVLEPLSFSLLQRARWSLSDPLGPKDVKDVIAVKAVAAVRRYNWELQLLLGPLISI